MLSGFSGHKILEDDRKVRMERTNALVKEYFQERTRSKNPRDITKEVNDLSKARLI